LVGGVDSLNRHYELSCVSVLLRRFLFQFIASGHELVGLRRTAHPQQPPAHARLDATLGDVINGKNAISPDVAIRLWKWWGNGPDGYSPSGGKSHRALSRAHTPQSSKSWN